MIGVVNVQADSPMDFYAAAPRRQLSIPKPEDQPHGSDEQPKSPVHRKLSYRPLFFRRNIERIGYAPDGRKTSNGEVVEVSK